MAKKSRSVVFTNATIDIEADEIVELRKDEMVTSSLSGVLKEWDGVDGISISIKHDSNYRVKPDEDEE